jgi:sulfofructose kinase
MPTLPIVDVVGVGLNAADTQLPVPHFPTSGAKIVIPSANVLLGGQVATAMAACQIWGLKTRYVGKLGDDHAAELHRAEFARLGIEAHIATAKDCTSPQSFILVEPTGERTVLLKRDARLTLLPEELQREWITNARILHLDGHDTAAATQAAQWARAAKIPVVADLDDLYQGYESLLPNIDYLIVSRDIPARLTSNPDLKTSLPEIAKKFGAKVVAATLGQEGVLAWHADQLHYAPAFNVPTVDTTGAGDIFHAAFIYALLPNWPIARQLNFANAAAALNCTAQGARGGIHPVPTIESLIATGQRHPSAT